MVIGHEFVGEVVEKGENVLFPEIRYFFYITNKNNFPKEEVVFSANKRCDQENIFGQLKSGIQALRMPSNNLMSNWAYMVIASLAWTFKAWHAMMIPDVQSSRHVLKMEFKKYLLNFISLPVQIILGARKITYRILGYQSSLLIFFEAYDIINRLRYG